RRTPLPQLIGSDIAHAVPLTLIAGIGHWFVGSVDWTLLLSLLVGSVPGIIIGTLLSVRLPDYILRPTLAITLLMVGGKLLL
ncbi:MAG: sulfite exporter TauE/SafE family protein, partial [Alphaproteobacteria bacterium]|nr:sulfite exporter TauE/SafE family protein [Alphaproteobacteria bacterium]